jgi:Predicted membrane protein (DUF2178).
MFSIDFVMVFDKWNNAKKFYVATLILGMLSFISLVSIGRNLLAVAVFVVSIVLMAVSDNLFDGPVYDERDVDLAQDSARKALMLTGVLGGAGAIVLFTGIELLGWSYPRWAPPVYLTWGSIVLLSTVVDYLQRKGVDI